MSKRCHYPDCNKKILSIAIDCDKCHNFYCGVHRIPESHECDFLISIKKTEFERNKLNLENNRLINVNKSLGSY